MSVAQPCFPPLDAHTAWVTPSRPLPRVLVRDVAAIALVVTLQFVYFLGAASSDDFNYFRLASCMQAHEPVPQELSYFLGRFVHWRLVQVAVWILPARPWAMAAPSLLATWGILLLLRSGMRRYVEPRHAWLAVLAYGLVPVAVLNASVAFPDVIAALLAWSGVLLVAGALLARGARHATVRCVGGGLLIMAGYSAKESVAALVPCLGLFVLLFHARCGWAWCRIGLLCLGSVLWIGFEMFLMWLWSGDPLAHPHGVAWGHRIAGLTVQLAPGPLLAYWSDYVRWLMDPRSELGPVGPVLLLALVLAFRRPTPFVKLLLCCVVPMFVYLSMGSSQFTTYFPLCHQQRYIVPMLPGMALIAASVIGRLWRSAATAPRAGMCLLGVGLLVGSSVAPDRFVGQWYHAATFGAGYEAVRRYVPNGATLLASQLTSNRFSLLSHWSGCGVEVVERPPTSDREWIDRYPGRLVLISRLDRVPGESRHASLKLCGAPLDSVSTFPSVGRVEPPAGRLASLAAKLTRRTGVPTMAAYAVEIRQIPAALQP